MKKVLIIALITSCSALIADVGEYGSFASKYTAGKYARLAQLKDLRDQINKEIDSLEKLPEESSTAKQTTQAGQGMFGKILDYLTTTPKTPEGEDVSARDTAAGSGVGVLSQILKVLGQFSPPERTNQPY